MMNNYSKKYGWMTTLSLLVLMNVPLNIAYNQSKKPRTEQQPLSSQQVQPKTPRAKSQIIVQPQASRRASQCYDNGVC